MADRLLAAVRDGKLDAFHALIQSKTVDLNKESLLHWAVLGRKVDMVDALLAAGADINWPGLHDGQTPLYVATSVLCTELVDRLLKAGANPNLGKLTGSAAGRSAPDAPIEILTSPLIKAIESGGIEIAKLLLNAGADVNQGDQDGYTPLTLATEKGNEDIVKLLLKYGASIEVCGPTGRSVYDMATKESIRKILTTHRPGQNVNPNDNSAAGSNGSGRRHKWSFFSMFRRSRSAETTEPVETVETAQVAGVKGPAVVRSVIAPAAVLNKSDDDTAAETTMKGNAATYAPPAVANSVSINARTRHHSNDRPPVAAIGVVGQVIHDDSVSVNALRQQLAAIERRVTELEAAALRDASTRKVVMQQARVIEQQSKDIALLKSQLNLQPSSS